MLLYLVQKLIGTWRKNSRGSERLDIFLDQLMTTSAASIQAAFKVVLWNFPELIPVLI